MNEETRKRLLDVIADYGDGWWNDDADGGVNAIMVLDELASFCKKAGVEITLKAANDQDFIDQNF